MDAVSNAEAKKEEIQLLIKLFAVSCAYEFLHLMNWTMSLLQSFVDFYTDVI